MVKWHLQLVFVAALALATPASAWDSRATVDAQTAATRFAGGADYSVSTSSGPQTSTGALPAISVSTLDYAFPFSGGATAEADAVTSANLSTGIIKAWSNSSCSLPFALGAYTACTGRGLASTSAELLDVFSFSNVDPDDIVRLAVGGNGVITSENNLYVAEATLSLRMYPVLGGGGMGAPLTVDFRASDRTFTYGGGWIDPTYSASVVRSGDETSYDWYFSGALPLDLFLVYNMYGRVGTMAEGGNEVDFGHTAELGVQLSDGVAFASQSGVFGAVSRLGVAGGVPEPSTWAMMLTGFFGLGSMLRLRRDLGAAC